MELSEVLNIVIAVCTVLLTIFAAIGLITWKHQNRFEEKIKILNDIHKTAHKLYYELMNSLVHIPMIQSDITLIAESDIGLEDQSLLDAVNRALDRPGENDALERCIKKNGLSWSKKLRLSVRVSTKSLAI